MARELALFSPPGLIVAADNSTKQYQCFKMDTTDNTVVVISAQGVRALGILQNKPNAAGQPADVMTHGMSKAYVGAAGAVVAGDLWTTGTDGKIETAASGDYVGGVVMEGGATGTLATVTLAPQGVL